MNKELIAIRLKSFGYELATLVVLGILGVLSSSEFSTLVTTHFGDTATASLILLVTSGIVKHVRNLDALKKSLGAKEKVQLI